MELLIRGVFAQWEGCGLLGYPSCEPHIVSIRVTISIDFMYLF